MNRQRKVVITTTYNDMGVIVDTKAEELDLSAQPEKRTKERTETHACDCISRRAAIDKFEPWLKVKGYNEGELNMLKAVLYELRVLPSAQPEIIRCRNCKFASGDSRICMKFGHSPIGELDFCSFAERRENE